MVSFLIALQSLLALANQHQYGLLTNVLYVSSSPHLLASAHAADTAISISQTFPTAFTESPQILYSIYSLHFENSASGGYVFQVTSQSETGFNCQYVLGFTVSVSAPTTQKIYNVLIKWLAFIDRGKQIVLQHLFTPESSESFSVTHFNQNFVMAVPILNYFVYSGSFSFRFNSVTVDSTKVTAVVTSSGITQLGLQLLISVDKPVFVYGPTQWTPPSSQLFNDPFILSNQNIPALQQSDFLSFTLFNGITSNVADEFNIEELSISVSSTMSLQIGSSISCSVTDAWMSEILISPNYQIPPLLLEQFFFTEYSDSTGSQPITVSIPSLGATYTTSSADWITVTNTFYGLQVFVTTPCVYKYKHNYWFLGSVKDNQPYIPDFFYCSRGFNRLRYQINLNDGGRLEYKSIKFVFTATSVEMYQKLDNLQFGEQYRNFKIAITQIR